MNDINNSTKRRRNNSTKTHDDESKKLFFIDTIAKYCDKCGTAYSTSDVHIVQESNFSSIIHFSCSNCKSNQIATFIKPMGISNRVPVNCDLSINEISSFAQFDKISSDEVLELFTYLEEHEKMVFI